MRKSVIITMILLLSLLVPASLLAAEAKIGVINIQFLMENSDPGRQAMAELRGKVQSMKANVEKQKIEITRLQEEMKKQSLVLSQEAKQDREIEFKRKVRDFQDMTRDYDRTMRTEQERLTKPIFTMAIEVIQEFGKKHKYAIMMDSRTSGLVYASEDMDVTKKVMVELNRAWRDKKRTKK